MTDTVRVTLVGGPTALIEYGGLRLLTDPTFDPPGEQGNLTKLTGPAVGASDLAPIDVVLLSHDQHADNLDDAGRALLADVPVVFTTSAAAARLEANTQALEPWQHIEIERPDAAPIVVYGVPAVHGPTGFDQASGPVIGFVLSAPESPTVYISGDNASLNVVEEIADNLGPIDGALLFCGRARVARIDANLTLSGQKAAQVAEILEPAWIVPVHTEGWAHFSEGVAEVVEAFEDYELEEMLVVVQPGETVELETEW
ncbi:MAG: MBL fold metallo-hydrolase [Microbacteriaceae bacterium]|nr:MBL fold metallo-hydrolase [Microbacteriaceae bacterium]MCL2796271.1 MBL fold metallo-hydrolase [Microbacteriaceae bacterium]